MLACGGIDFMCYIKFIVELPVSDTEREREKHKNKIVKELAKLGKKPDLILCEPYYLWANFDGEIVTDIIGVPIVYASLSGKPYMFVWFNDDLKELNKQCEKILKEKKK